MVLRAVPVTSTRQGDAVFALPPVRLSTSGIPGCSCSTARRCKCEMYMQNEPPQFSDVLDHPRFLQEAHPICTIQSWAAAVERTQCWHERLIPVTSNPSPCASPLMRGPESTSQGCSLDIYMSADMQVVCFTYCCPDFSVHAMNNLQKPCVSISLLFIIMK